MSDADAETPRCDGCAHWRPPGWLTRFSARELPTHGECAHAGLWYPAEGEHAGPPPPMVLSDKGEDIAELWTAADFFCRDHEPKAGGAAHA